MSSRERVQTVFAHEEPDRVPVNYFTNPNIDQRLKEHYGLHVDDDEGLRLALGVDCRAVVVPYVGPQLFADIPGLRVSEWGIRMRWIEHSTGGYWDYVDFPLKDATLDEIEAWPMPSPDDYDYSQVAAQCAALQDYCVVWGRSGVPDLINGTSMLRTMEQVLIDMIMREPALLRYFERRSELLLEVSARALEASKGDFHLFHMGDGLGTQIGPLMSLELYRDVIRPVHQKFVDLAKSYGLYSMIHSCGTSR